MIDERKVQEILVMKVEQKRFSESLSKQNDDILKEITKKWNAKKSEFIQFSSATTSQYSTLLVKLESIHQTLANKLLKIKKECSEMEEDAKKLRSTIREKEEDRVRNEIDAKAEVDMEISMQRKSVELISQLNEIRGRIQVISESKINYKKKYIRIINEYKSIEREEEEEERKKRLKAIKQKQKEEYERRLKEEKNEELPNPLKQQYQSLLVAAGQVHSDPKPSVLMIHEPTADDEKLIIENNINTLLSTGNYTENDEIIKNLRAQLN